MIGCAPAIEDEKGRDNGCCHCTLTGRIAAQVCLELTWQTARAIAMRAAILCVIKGWCCSWSCLNHDEPRVVSADRDVAGKG